MRASPAVMAGVDEPLKRWRTRINQASPEGQTRFSASARQLCREFSRAPFTKFYDANFGSMSEKFFREAVIERGAIDVKNRRVQLAFSSELAVDREDGEEILSHDDGDYDLSRLNNGGPLLLDHDTRKQIGVVESAKIGPDKKGRAMVRFSKSPLGEEIFQDVKDGIRQKISVGYTRTGVTNGTSGRRYQWAAHEISIVSVPADDSVGVGRNQPVIETRSMNAQDKNVALGDMIKKQMPHLETAICELNARALVSEMSETDYRRSLDALMKTQRKETWQSVEAPSIGMDDEDIAGFSITRAIRTMIYNRDNPHNKQSCPEFDLTDECNRKYGRRAAGFWIPAEVTFRGRGGYASRGLPEVLRRDMQVGVFNQGGAFVPTLLETTPIEILRNKMVLKGAGMQVMGGLTGNVAIPRQTGPGTAYSLGEIALVTLSTQSIDQIALNPKRVSAQNNYSKQLLIQSSIDIENFMRNDLMTVCALKADYLGLNGTGGNSEPIGIINTPGIGSVMFGGSATYSNLVKFETALAVLNADRGAMAYVTTPTVRGVLKSAAKLLVGATTVAATPLWEDGNLPDVGRINGFPAHATNQVLNNAVIFGNFNDLIMGLFGGIDIVVDPYTKAGNAEVVITINMFLDFACRHAQSFCVSADPGNQ